MKEEQGVCGKVRYLNEIYEKIPRMYQPLKEVRSEIDQDEELFDERLVVNRVARRSIRLR